MNFRARVARAQARLPDAILWQEAQRLAAETGERPEDLYAQGRQLAERYGHLQIDLPGGRVDIEPMLRAMARDEGLDYEALSLAAVEVVRDMQREVNRRRRRLRAERARSQRE